MLTTVASVASAFLYLSRQIPVYASSSRLYVQQINPKLIGDGLGQPSGAATQVELIASDPLLQAVADLPEIQQLPIMAGVPNRLAVIRAGLAINADRDFINISYESPHRVDAAQLVNAIAQQYVDYLGKQRHSSAPEVLRILQAEKLKREKEFDERLHATLDYKRKHPSISIGGDGKDNILLDKLAKLSELYTTAQLETLDATANLQSVDSLRSDPKKLLDLARVELPKEQPDISIENVTPAAVAIAEAEDARLGMAADAIRGEIEGAERQLQRLRRTRTPEHRDVKEAQAELAMLHERLARAEGQIEQQLQARQARTDAERQRSSQQQRTAQAKSEEQQRIERDREMVDTYLTLVRRRADRAVQREAQLKAQFEQQKREALDLSTVAAEYGFIEADMRRAEKLVQTLEDKIKEINVTEDTNIVKVTTVDVARPAAKPIRPDRTRVLGMALLLGLVIGVGVAFGLDALDQRLQSIEEITAAIDAPVLGLVPHIEQKATQSVRGRKVQLEPTSDVAESYRTIRTAVYFAVRETEARKILVTSPAPGDGKSTTASNLAIAMAQAGRRVLLLDADFRRPTQHKIFETDGGIGLSKVMAGLAPIEAVIQPTGVDSLNLIACGPLPANPSEILNGQAFADLLGHLQREYDHLVIDSPPVAAVTDARILSALCDETILVLRAHKATRRLTEHAREALVSVGARILGVVINDVPRRRDRYGYYYGYGYGYGYGYRYGQYGANGNGNGNGENGAPTAVAGTSV